jgi:hypothetical protein
MPRLLKEPNRLGNTSDNIVIIASARTSAQYHLVTFSGELQQYELAIAAYSRQRTIYIYGERIAEYAPGRFPGEPQ